MKTAMQELVEWCNQYEGQMISADQVVLHAHKLFVKEKEQISKAWDDGDYAYFYSKETGRDFDNGEDYFNEKYKKQ